MATDSVIHVRKSNSKYGYLYSTSSERTKNVLNVYSYYKNTPSSHVWGQPK